MTPPLAHVAGVPVEETALAFVPFVALWLGFAGAYLRRHVLARGARRRQRATRTRGAAARSRDLL